MKEWKVLLPREWKRVVKKCFYIYSNSRSGWSIGWCCAPAATATALLYVLTTWLTYDERLEKKSKALKSNERYIDSRLINRAGRVQSVFSWEIYALECVWKMKSHFYSSLQLQRLSKFYGSVESDWSVKNNPKSRDGDGEQSIATWDSEEKTN